MFVKYGGHWVDGKDVRINHAGVWLENPRNFVRHGGQWIEIEMDSKHVITIHESYAGGDWRHGYWEPSFGDLKPKTVEGFEGRCTDLNYASGSNANYVFTSSSVSDLNKTVSISDGESTIEIILNTEWHGSAEGRWYGDDVFEFSKNAGKIIALDIKSENVAVSKHEVTLQIGSPTFGSLGYDNLYEFIGKIESRHSDAVGGDINRYMQSGSSIVLQFHAKMPAGKKVTVTDSSGNSYTGILQASGGYPGNSFLEFRPKRIWFNNNYPPKVTLTVGVHTDAQSP